MDDKANTEAGDKGPSHLIGALLLTERKPFEIKSALWAKQATADMLANTTDFRHGFKTSSLVCPFCRGTVEGQPVEDPLTSKKKPWEINVEHLVHEDPTQAARCPLTRPGGLRDQKDGRLIEKILFCHLITHSASLGHTQEATGETHPLHEDPSIPKMHHHRDTEEKEWLEGLLDAEALGQEETQWLLAEEEKRSRSNTVLPEGNLQRLFPFVLPKEAPPTWEAALEGFPRWSETHPGDPEAPEVTGWIVCSPDKEKGPVALCGYVLGDNDENKEWPENYPVPIYSVLGPDPFLDPANQSPVPFLETELLTGPAKEALEWTEASTVQQLKKREKNRRKQRIHDEVARLPKERIWEGFINPDLAGDPSIDRPGEPPQTLKGYRPGGDVKKWWLPGVGNPHAKIWVIGLYPSNEEIKRKGGPKILSGASGDELFSLAREAGLDLSKDVFFENIVKRFMPPKSKIGTEVKAEQMWLLARQLAYYRPERIICLGAEVYKEVVGGKSFQDLRGTWTEASYPRVGKNLDERWTGRVAGTFHPAGVLRPEGRHNLELFRHDFRELVLDSEATDVNPSIREIKTMEDALGWVERELIELSARGDDVIYSVDTEGYTLNAESDELVCLQVSKLIGAFDAKCGRLEVKEVPQHCDVFLFQENPEPESYDAEVFEDPEAAGKKDETQLSLFEGGGEEKKTGAEEPAKEEKILPPVVNLANSEEEKQEILRAHATKKRKRGLILFTPYRKIEHLKGKEKELGKALNRLSRHPKCRGFVITNANYDRVRLEKLMGWDLTLPAKNGGLGYPLDTMLLEHILDENSDLGLKACLNKHFNWPRQDAALDNFADHYGLDKIKGKIKNPDRQSVWSLYPWSVLRPYAAKDAYGTAALLAKQLEDLDGQILRYQRDRVMSNNPNTLERAFHISCGAINGTYEMHKMGMPVGEKGMGILKELTGFYEKHEAAMISQYQEAVFQLTGLRDANPASPEELAFVLFNENSPLRKQGIEPWKESGRAGRLWEEIPKEERPHATPSTDAESLEIIASTCADPKLQKFLMRLSETKTILTIRSSFLPDADSKKGIIGRINPVTLCMHTTYTPTLDTNRCRSIPNLSTFPKDEVEQVKKILGEAPPHRIREIIQAPDGAWLLNRDWATAEVLGIGYLAQDENMLRIISRMNRGMDFHCKLAVKTYGKIQETFRLVTEHPEPPNDWLNANFQEGERGKIREFWKKQWAEGRPTPATEEEMHAICKKLFKQERSNIKPVTFGVPYGREAGAIMKALNREYYVRDTRDAAGEIVKISKEEAQMMIDSYKTEFPQAWSYLVAQAESAKEEGFLRDHWGYVRHFPKGMKEGDLTRKAYNYQIQHIVAVLMNQAMHDWTVRREVEKLRSYSYSTLYDNIGWVVYEDELQKVWDISMEVMTAQRPVGPKDGEMPVLNKWHIPTEGALSKAWDGKETEPSALGIIENGHLNLTGLEAEGEA
jgi:uracil-DNA glycosylase family 4